MGKEINNQTAGDNSNQIQTDTININYYTLSELQAKDIFDKLSKKVDEEICEGIQIANQRIKQFENIVIPKIQSIENDFKSFSDPSFQLLLRKAQFTSASSEREIDNNLLSELIVNRIKNKNDIKKKTSIEKAVEIIDKIDYDALCGLTLFYGMSTFIPNVGNIELCLNYLSDFYSELQYEKLPSGLDWLDNLDILKVVRINGLSKFLSCEEFLCKKLNGITCVGIKTDTEEYREFYKELQSVNLGFILVKHELLDGYARIEISDISNIDKLMYNINITNSNGIFTLHTTINNKQKEIINRIFNAYSQDRNLLEKVKKAFIEKLYSYESIKQVIEWWNSLNKYFEITSIGRVIAQANAKRIDNNIPDID